MSAFMRLFAFYFIFFDEASVQIFCQFLGLFVFFLLSFENLSHVLDPDQLDICFENIFLPVYILCFCYLNSVFSRAKVPTFDKIQIINFFFLELCFFQTLGKG